MTVMVVSFIVFTPVKRWIPGYGDIKENTEFVELTKRIDELEKQVQAHDTYTMGLKKYAKIH